MLTVMSQYNLKSHPELSLGAFCLLKGVYMRPWVKWLVKHKMKFVVYLVWLIVLPLFLLAYAGDAARDAMNELNDLKNFKGE